FSSSPYLQHLHSFPTRRSSDLKSPVSVSPFRGRTCGGSTLELPNFSVEGLRWFVKASLPYFLTLMVRQLGKPAAREFQEFPVLVDRKSTRLNSSHLGISYAVFC